MAITVNSTSYSTIRFAYFAKPQTDAAINGLKDSLQLGQININSYRDVTLEDSHFKIIKNIIRNPRLQTKMLLNLKTFMSFTFDTFIYLKHKDLQGYFFVEKIDNYKDGVTPVRVDLLYID
jgi:hypothetical protein